MDPSKRDLVLRKIKIKKEPRYLIFQIPLAVTLGMAFICQIAYGVYSFTTDFGEGAYIPMKSEYDDICKGFKNLKKRFSAKKTSEETK